MENTDIGRDTTGQKIKLLQSNRRRGCSHTLARIRTLTYILAHTRTRTRNTSHLKHTHTHTQTTSHEKARTRALSDDLARPRSPPDDLTLACRQAFKLTGGLSLPRHAIEEEIGQSNGGFFRDLHVELFFE